MKYQLIFLLFLPFAMADDHLDQMLITAVDKGSIELATKYLDQNADASTDNSRPLYYAMWNGDVPMFQLLLDRGADLRQILKVGFIGASSQDHIEMLEKIVNKAREKEIPQKEINSAIESGAEISCIRDRPNSVKFFLDNFGNQPGLDLNSIKKCKSTKVKAYLEKRQAKLEKANEAKEVAENLVKIDHSKASPKAGAVPTINNEHAVNPERKELLTNRVKKFFKNLPSFFAKTAGSN